MGAVEAARVASWRPVKLLVSPNVATVALDAGNVTVTPSVPSRVMLLLTVNVLLSAMVTVAPVEGCVSVSLLIVPGSTMFVGREKVQVPVVVTVQVPPAVIWLVVPARVILVTVPVPGTAVVV
jgi:hypothetical protein